MALGIDRNRTGVAGIKFCEKEETDKKLPFEVASNKTAREHY